MFCIAPITSAENKRGGDILHSFRLAILLVALLCCGFCFGVVYEQKESQRQLTTITSDWSATYQISCWKYDVELFKLRDEIEEYKHSIWHLQQKQDQYYEAWQDALDELIDRGLYKLDTEVSGEYGSLRSYKRVDLPPTVETVKYRNIFPRQFENIDQFEEWYKAQDLGYLLPNGSKADTADCDDYASRLQRIALEQGYSVSQALVLDGRYYGIRVSGDRGGHTGSLVLVDSTYYYVEPEPSKFKMVKLVERD